MHDKDSEKQCSKCGESYPATKKYFRKKGNGLRPECKRCSNSKDKKYYYDKGKQGDADRCRQKKLDAIEYKGGKCSRCGYDDLRYPAVFEFHHLDPNEKEAAPAKMLQKHPLEKCKEELDKCILLCSNCHRIVHSQNNLEIPDS